METSYENEPVTQTSRVFPLPSTTNPTSPQTSTRCDNISVTRKVNVEGYDNAYKPRENGNVSRFARDHGRLFTPKTNGFFCARHQEEGPLAKGNGVRGDENAPVARTNGSLRWAKVEHEKISGDASPKIPSVNPPNGVLHNHLITNGVVHSYENAPTCYQTDAENRNVMGKIKVPSPVLTPNQLVPPGKGVYHTYNGEAPTKLKEIQTGQSGESEKRNDEVQQHQSYLFRPHNKNRKSLSRKLPLPPDSTSNNFENFHQNNNSKENVELQEEIEDLKVAKLDTETVWKEKIKQEKKMQGREIGKRKTLNCTLEQLCGQLQSYDDSPRKHELELQTQQLQQEVTQLRTQLNQLNTQNREILQLIITHTHQLRQKNDTLEEKVQNLNVELLQKKEVIEKLETHKKQLEDEKSQLLKEMESENHYVELEKLESEAKLEESKNKSLENDHQVQIELNVSAAREEEKLSQEVLGLEMQIKKEKVRKKRKKKLRK